MSKNIRPSQSSASEVKRSTLWPNRAAQKAAVTAYDPATGQFKANSFDIVAAHEILTPVANKARLLQQREIFQMHVGIPCKEREKDQFKKIHHIQKFCWPLLA